MKQGVITQMSTRVSLLLKIEIRLLQIPIPPYRKIQCSPKSSLNSQELPIFTVIQSPTSDYGVFTLHSVRSTI